jgi:hypothetical protein
MKYYGMLLLLPLLIAGCAKSTEQGNLELQQQKLTLELMKSLRDQSSELIAKDHQLRALEKKNADTLADIDNRRSALQKMEQESAQRRDARQAALTHLETEIRSAGDQLRAKQAELAAVEAKKAAALKQIELANTELYRHRAAQRLAPEETRASAEARQAAAERQQQQSERLKSRQVFLTGLATLVNKIVKRATAGGAGPVDGELREGFEKNSVLQLPSDEQFENAAKRVAEQIAAKEARGLLTEDRDAIRDFSYHGGQKASQVHGGRPAPSGNGPSATSG